MLPALHRVGIDPDRINYTAKTSTANGIAMAAPVMIDALTVGGITVRNAARAMGRAGAPKATAPNRRTEHE